VAGNFLDVDRAFGEQDALLQLDAFPAAVEEIQVDLYVVFIVRGQLINDSAVFKDAHVGQTQIHFYRVIVFREVGIDFSPAEADEALGPVEVVQFMGISFHGNDNRNTRDRGNLVMFNFGFTLLRCLLGLARCGKKYQQDQDQEVFHGYRPFKGDKNGFACCILHVWSEVQYAFLSMVKGSRPMRTGNPA
jgi:hypothetical protein